MDKLIKENLQRVKLYLLPILVGISSVVVVVLVLIPQLVVYFGQRGKIEKEQNLAAVLEAKALELEKLDDRVYAAGLQTVLKILPTDQDIPQALVITSELAKRNSLELEEMKFFSPITSSETEAGKGGSLQLSLALSGPLPLIKNFLADVQNAPRLIKINSLEGGPKRGGNVYEMTVVVSFFHEPTPSSLGSLDAPLQGFDDQDQKILAKLRERVTAFGAILTSLPTTGLETLPPEALETLETGPVALGKENPFE